MKDFHAVIEVRCLTEVIVLVGSGARQLSKFKLIFLEKALMNT
ncbi:hypothetical protein [Anaerobacillus alkalilacustris]|nr:hypothetical protein [Anaerobacillus alkalilacustris]